MNKIITALMLSAVAATPAWAADAVHPALPANGEVPRGQAASNAPTEMIRVDNCAPDKNKMSAPVRKQLQEVAQHLAGKRNLRLEVAGHADDRRLPGHARNLYGDNVGVSAARAQVAADFLRSQPGFANVAIKSIGKGASEPKAHCDGKMSSVKREACLVPNRRVEILAWYDAEKPVAKAPAVVVAASAVVAVPVTAINAAPAIVASVAPVDVAKVAPVEAAKATPMDASKAASAEATKAAPVSASNAEPAAVAEIAQPAPVAEQTSAPAEAASKGFYVAADLGQARFSNAASAYLANESFYNPLVVRVGGGYRFNEYIGVESGYALVGESSIKSTGTLVFTEKLQTSVFHIAAVGTYAISDNFDVFGKLGLAYNKMDYTFSGTTTTPTSGSGSGSKTNLMFGLGVQYNIDKHYGIRAQYENFGTTSVTASFNNGKSANTDIGVSMIAVGGVYNF